MFHHSGCNGIQIDISFEKQLLRPPVDSVLYFYINFIVSIVLDGMHYAGGW